MLASEELLTAEIATRLAIIKQHTTESYMSSLQRVIYMVDFIAEKEGLTKQMRVRAQLLAMDHTPEIQQSEALLNIVADAKTFNKLGVLGMIELRACAETIAELRTWILHVPLYTATGLKIAKHRKNLALQYLCDLEMELSFGDVEPFCHTCKSENNIKFLKCHHSFCEKCALSGHEYVHCPVCDVTHYKEEPRIWSDLNNF
jgi:hypothetical protein